MTYDRSIVSVIETALDRNRFCRSCGAHTTVRSDADRILIECSAAIAPRSRLGRLAAYLFPHERVVVAP